MGTFVMHCGMTLDIMNRGCEKMNVTVVSYIRQALMLYDNFFDMKERDDGTAFFVSRVLAAENYVREDAGHRR